MSARRPRQRKIKLRIIGGELGGRVLMVPPAAGLRPTLDRIRETVFNWLAPYVPGARCLDLFAGTGALGLEALSRGASHTTFVETHRKIATHLKSQAEALGIISRCEIINQDALTWLKSVQRPPYDIIFLDPPYHKDLIQPVVNQLAELAILSPGAYIYMEHEHPIRTLDMPASWIQVKEKKTAQFIYALYQTEGQGTSMIS